MRKRILISVLSVFAVATAFAQGQGLAGINEATSMMTSYFDPGDEIVLRYRCCLGLDRRYQNLQQIQ